MPAHNIFSVLPAGLCGAHSHSLPSYSGAWRKCTLPCHASLTGTAATRHHLRPLVQAARQRNKQLNQPTNLAAQKPGRSQTSCDVFVVCLTVSHSVPVSVSGSQSPRQSVFFVTIVRLLHIPFPVSKVAAASFRFLETPLLPLKREQPARIASGTQILQVLSRTKTFLPSCVLALGCFGESVGALRASAHTFHVHVWNILQSSVNHGRDFPPSTHNTCAALPRRKPAGCKSGGRGGSHAPSAASTDAALP